MEIHLQNAAVNEVFAAVEQLPSDELEQFVNRILALRAARRAPYLSKAEAELLEQINQSLPENKRQRLRQLQHKRDSENISANEWTELAGLTDEVEEIYAQRMKAVAEWAALRGVAFGEAMKQFDLKLPEDE